MPVPIPGGTMEGVAEGFQPMPAGIYPAQVVDLEETKTSSEAKNPNVDMLKWTFEITDDEYAGQKAFTNTVLTEKALPLYRALLKGLGFSDSDIDSMDSTVDRDDVVGRTCRLVLRVGKNPKTGLDNNSVASVLPFEEADTSELPG